MLPSFPKLPSRFWLACIGAFVLGFGIRVLAADLVDPTESAPGPDPVPAAVNLLAGPSSTAYTMAPYRGLGAWIDAFDFDPAYAEGEPPLAPGVVVDEMADLGVQTIYIQAARRDDRATEGLLDQALLAEILLRAHARGMHVVAWYLPLFDDIDADLEKTLALADFSVQGHRFDGVAIDIEYTAAVADPIRRSEQLIDYSQRLRTALDGQVIGAIVPAAVHLEVINPHFWPSFPWRSIDAAYDVWLPMTYSTDRTTASGYRDAYAYAEESARRMRINLDRHVDVHLIGGIGDALGAEGIARLSEAIRDTGAIGGSVYDWNSMSEETRQLMPQLLDPLE